MNKINDIRLFHGFKEYFEVYLPKVRSKSEKTVNTYRAAVNLYNDYIKMRDHKELFMVSVNDYTALSILEFRDWLQNERGNSIATLNLRLAAIRGFCKYLMKDDPMLIEELSKILDIEKIPDSTKKELIYLTLDQLEILFQQPDIHTKAGLRDHFFLELMYYSGCRDQEILDLQIKDFIIDKDTVSVKIVGKGTKFRMTPISPKILPLFYRYRDVYLKDCSPDDLMFFTVRKGIKDKMSDDNVARFMNKYEKKIRETYPSFPHLHPHLLRHSRAMNLYIYGMPLAMISEWLGHTQLETTTIYAQATTEMKRKQAEKAEKANSKVFKDEVFNYANDDEMIKRLYGLK